jgi:hypothetical protein
VLGQITGAISRLSPEDPGNALVMTTGENYLVRSRLVEVNQRYEAAKN